MPFFIQKASAVPEQFPSLPPESIVQWKEQLAAEDDPALFIEVGSAEGVEQAYREAVTNDVNPITP